MTVTAKTAARALLPNGLRDVLPPDAAFEVATVEHLVSVFAANGYDRVKTPLIEFEEGLLTGASRATAGQTFRVMDPITQRMMGLRADITIQVARLAASRLAKAPRPLRLTYSGQVLRVKGTQLRPERQFTQAGIELIGAGGVDAIAESVLLTVEALAQAGLPRVTVDLNCPPLVPALCRALGLSEDLAGELRKLLEQKDFTAAAALAGDAAGALSALSGTVGPAERALPALAALDLPGEAAGHRDALLALARKVMIAAPEVDVTVDPLEHKGFEYYTGCSFALFAQGARGELGRGGEYPGDLNGTVEPCCGATLYMDAVLDGMVRPAPAPRVLVASTLARTTRRALQADGWVTVPALTAEAGAAEARRLGCGHVLDDEGRPVAV
ncbi:ATP phosphoribosyltransferase regulatory subunit [Rhodospirillum rubrum]|uniref:ATP phosphoribosyltransferase regulatory subunit n=1 Tax=Rhodospirillum rubrum TaxID=1085 RepID=UPI00190580E4|nr:ATP phosphoribosyltransferase regulatory subunit [Rhodospirillum rubrum]MBK1664865.1 ATP phosphoribosyltransferase regulatory subunit [Rhodospirillum rubrum]MBK1676298.1 ATP phosphoribosyltransferase regulatory subunit [Rhodospirillum rubrum]